MMSQLRTFRARSILWAFLAPSWYSYLQQQAGVPNLILLTLDSMSSRINGCRHFSGNISEKPKKQSCRKTNGREESFVRQVARFPGTGFAGWVSVSFEWMVVGFVSLVRHQLEVGRWKHKLTKWINKIDLFYRFSATIARIPVTVRAPTPTWLLRSSCSRTIILRNILRK